MSVSDSATELNSATIDIIHIETCNEMVMEYRFALEQDFKKNALQQSKLQTARTTIESNQHSLFKYRSLALLTKSKSMFQH